MKKLLTICLMLLGAVAQAQNFAITATTEAAIRKNIVKGNAANYGFGMINDTLKLVGLTTRNVIFTGSTSKTDIGLGNVDNTSDLNKPISTATQTALNLKQNQLNGTGFVKASGTTISYDNSTYLSTSSASSTYLPIANPTATGTLTAPTIANSLGATFATSSGSITVGNITAQTGALIGARRAGNSFEFGHSNQAGYQSTLGANAGNGHSFLALNSEAGTTSNTFRTRGLAGRVIVNNVDFNRLDFQRVTSATADNQTPLTDFSIFSTGRVGINTTTDAGYLTDINGTLRTVNDAYFATSSGNVGIGTTSPNAPLQFANNTVNRKIVLYENTNNDHDFYGFGVNSGILRYQTGIGANHVFYAGATSTTSNELMRIQSNGNVGIGTTSPLTKFHTKRTGLNGAGLASAAIISTDGKTIGDGISLDFFGHDSGNNEQGYGSFRYFITNPTAGAESSELSITTWNAGSNTERIRFASTGIGIGTTSPNASSILDITSTTKGVLFPRMTTGEINNITSPADGLTVYNTTLKAICFYDSSAAVWKKVSHSNM